MEIGNIARLLPFFCGVAFFAGCGEETPSNQDPWDNISSSEVVVLAHRGCWKAAPEVSIGSIEACEAIGAHAVEIDVRTTKDGALVLLHDASVDRTTNGSGLLKNMTLAEVRTLRLKQGLGGSGAALTSELVPTLEEALIAAKGKFVVNLHLKDAAESKVAEIVKRTGMIGQTITWVEGRSNDARLESSPLRGIVGLVPRIHECQTVNELTCWVDPVESLVEYAAYQPPAFFLDYRNRPEFIEQVCRAEQPQGTRIFVETLGPVDRLPDGERRKEWRYLIDMGVSIIMTDHPAELVEFLQSKDFN